jgi:hypothetical protein
MPFLSGAATGPYDLITAVPVTLIDAAAGQCDTCVHGGSGRQVRMGGEDKDTRGEGGCLSSFRAQAVVTSFDKPSHGVCTVVQGARKEGGAGRGGGATALRVLRGARLDRSDMQGSWHSMQQELSTYISQALTLQHRLHTLTCCCVVRVME